MWAPPLASPAPEATLPPLDLTQAPHTPGSVQRSVLSFPSSGRENPGNAPFQQNSLCHVPGTH